MGVETLLSAHRLTKKFGGLAAVNEVSIDLWQDRIHVVIGPNGAGKSTLTNLLSATSQILTSWLRPPVARSLPLWEKATCCVV